MINDLDSDAVWQALRPEEQVAVLRAFAGMANPKMERDELPPVTLGALLTVRTRWDGYPAFAHAMNYNAYVPEQT